MKRKIVVLTGAGVSAESGISTFRDSNGLWENHDIMDVASPQGWQKNQALVLDFYNQRRKQLLEVSPNAAHLALVQLEDKYDVHIVTQNVDDLHERAGSSQVVHLHGELLKARSTADESIVYDWSYDIHEGDCCALGSQLRPHIVWFGEMVPLLEHAAYLVSMADIILIIGTSMQVYPAAGLIDYAAEGVPIFYIDPHPSLNRELQGASNLIVRSDKATVGVPLVVRALMTL